MRAPLRRTKPLPTHRTTSADRPAQQPHPRRHARNDLVLELVVVEQELTPLATPVVGLEEDVDAALAALADGTRGHADGDALREVEETERRAGIRLLGVLLQPLPQDFVPAPIAADELVRGELLQDVARVLVEDREE